MEKESLDVPELPAMLSRTPTLQPVLLAAEPTPLEMDVQRTAVIVIDVQNAFACKGGFFDLRGEDISAIQKVIEPIKKITTSARAKGLKVIYVVHVYAPDLCDSGGPNSPNWYKDSTIAGYREHTEWRDKFYVRGTWGANIIDELKPKKGDLFVEKPRFSAFFQTNLDIILKTFNVKYLIFVGLTTNICVEASIRDAYNFDYFPILVSDAVMNNGPAFTQEATIYNIQCVYGWVTSTESILRAIG